jgi:hypothetical protein
MVVDVHSDQGYPLMGRAALWGFIGIGMVFGMSSHAFQNVDDYIKRRYYL